MPAGPERTRGAAAADPAGRAALSCRPAPRPAAARAGDEPLAGARITVGGIVQGVGFRPWACRRARAAGIAGRVRNDARGVTIDATGPPQALAAFVEDLRAAPAPARVDWLEWEARAPEAADGFVIDASEGSGARSVTVAPDLATCPACLAEILDPGDRRHGYAFTSCTRCGPRFTITVDMPYDRERTTMAGFRMCAACRAEYVDPGDRRFHAQANACAACGPRLAAVTPDGARATGDPLATAARWLREGRIVAVKGLGGFHLACDATAAAAVERLRARKGREAKPLAVMVADAEAAARLAELDGTEAELLASPARPIVLARRRPSAAVAPGVAPGNPLVGVFLPYTPLHHLLLRAAGRPLIMTSGNRSEEPIAADDAEALARLRGIADGFLLHDRPIAVRCDDAVARVVAGAPMLLRRSRGYVPEGIPVAGGFAQPVLGCGAHQKVAVCLGAGPAAHLGPHVGDLGTVAAAEAYRAAVDHMERILAVRPEAVAHDLHPAYWTTAFARERAGATRIGVQHHHAHVVAVLAEHGLADPVIGLAFDGTGYGPDGALWGGEFLLAWRRRYERVATFRAFGLAGGEAAIREVWRQALAVLDDAFDGAPPLARLPLFGMVPPGRLGAVRAMLRGGPNTPRAHGVGRYFDAVGALVLGRPTARFEAEVAMACEFAATDGDEPYAWALDTAAAPWTVDLRPAVRALVDDLLSGCPAGTVLARFHATVVRATIGAVDAISARYGRLPVVLAGGCFQNARLTAALVAALGGRAVVPRAVPPNDGGIALGQAVVADAVLRAGAAGGDDACVSVFPGA